MKYLTFLLLIIPVYGFSQTIITEDVYRFWNAYDAIIKEKDAVQQLHLINTLYIEPGTPGLKAIMEARRYTAEEYIDAINHYPQFWNSVRKNTLQANQFSKEIEKGIEKLKAIYPSLKPVDIYFEIGILRTGGTTLNGLLLIGSELALSDTSTISEEIDVKYPYLRTYFDTNPINDVSFLNIHEYIHTQQKETIGNTLLSQTIMEGVAEFVAEITLSQKSPNPQIEFGYKNEKAIKEAYQQEMFSPNIYNWIMNDPNNQFGMRDLGYFVGYAICKKYYDQSVDKKRAVKEMIELDYNNETALIKFVEKTNYFDQPLSVYKSEYETKRPEIIRIEPITNGSQKVSPNTKTITLFFSEEMNPNFRNFEYGPLGENNLLRITKIIGFSEDRKSFTFETELKSEKQYQILINFGFRSLNGYHLIPYLIDFKTSK